MSDRLSVYRPHPAPRLQDTRALRRVVTVGARAAQLGLDLIPGVVYVEIRDHGAPGVTMGRGQVSVIVWGGPATDVLAAVERNRPKGLAMAVEARRARWWHRARAAMRWWMWRLFRDPRKRLP